jgi:hypothetical protein
MFGALEVKIISRLAGQHSEWKPLHSAVLGCLLAHRNRQGQSWPEQKTIAAFCAVSIRTIGRVLTELSDWGAIQQRQLRALSSQQLGPAQYVFLFTLPQSVEEKMAPSDKSTRAVGQIQAEPSDKIEGAIRKKHQDLKPERAEAGTSPPPFVNPSNRWPTKAERRRDANLAVNARVKEKFRERFAQQDFDERDWRKLQEVIDRMRQASIGSADETDRVAFFKLACERSGISTRRGNELYERMLA